MRKVGSTTDTADSNGEYTNGNVANGISPTIINAEMLNTFQRELVSVVEGAGIALDPEDDGQVLKAMNKMFNDGRLLGIVRFTSSGTYTPSTGAKYARVTVTGAGGGGGGCQGTSGTESLSGGGGGAGGTAIGYFALSQASYNVVVGSGGAGGNGANPGGNGGASSINGVSGAGGFGGQKGSATNLAGGAGGSASGGSLNIQGGFGFDGQNGSLIMAGNGASSYWGGGGRAGSDAGISGGAYGSGGGGAYDPSMSGGVFNGGNGASGLVYIEEFY